MSPKYTLCVYYASSKSVNYIYFAIYLWLRPDLHPVGPRFCGTKFGRFSPAVGRSYPIFLLHEYRIRIGRFGLLLSRA